MSIRRPIYLDYAATTPVDARVVEKMLGYLTRDGEFGNPASRTHVYGLAAEASVERARQQVADFIGADPREIVWTSGATESNNLALKGAARAHRAKGRHIVTCRTEHKAVLDTCRWLERDGFEVTYLKPEPDGLIPLDRVEVALRPDTIALSIMHVNNETGVIQDIAAIGALARARGVLFHVDAAQSAGKIALDLRTLDVDLMSFSAHKFYGPKGVGALYVRREPRALIEPLIHGGGQEHGLRSGTLAVHQIVAMGEACHIAEEESAAEAERLRVFGAQLHDGLMGLDEVYLNGAAHARVPHILNVSFADIDSEALVMGLRDLATSTGSACTSAGTEPSHVLRAQGCSDERIRGSVRFSIGRFTTAAEIAQTLQSVSTQLARLRGISPLWELRQAKRAAAVPRVG